MLNIFDGSSRLSEQGIKLKNAKEIATPMYDIRCLYDGVQVYLWRINI